MRVGTLKRFPLQRNGMGFMDVHVLGSDRIRVMNSVRFVHIYIRCSLMVHGTLQRDIGIDLRTSGLLFTGGFLNDSPPINRLALFRGHEMYSVPLPFIIYLGMLYYIPKWFKNTGYT